MLKLHNLKTKVKRKRKRRLGRGNASGAGNYSGHGMKGQKARSGGRHKGRHAGKKFPTFIGQIPKKRGFRSIHPSNQVVNLSDLEKHFKSGQTIDGKALVKAGLIDDEKLPVKVLGSGQITKKLIIRVNNFSKSAVGAIKKAGGEAIFITKPAVAKRKK